MKRFFIESIKILIFLLIGITLFYLVYRDMDVSTITKELKNLKYGWIILSFIIALLSHFSRAIRWRLLIEPLGKKPRILNVFLSVMVMYLANLAIPRSGEVTRCGILKKYENIKFTNLLGTVVVERGMDLLFLLLLTIALFLTQFPVISSFIENNPEVQQNFGFITSTGFIMVMVFAAIFGLGILIYLWKTNSKFVVIVKLKELLTNIFDGIKTIWHMSTRWQFFFHTIFIYVMYFLMTYFMFLSYEPTENISLTIAYAVLIMGSFGMVAPVQGGIGAYHFMVIETLFIYSIPKLEGKIFALIAHTSMTLMLIVVGLISLVLLPLINRAYNK